MGIRIKSPIKLIFQEVDQDKLKEERIDFINAISTIRKNVTFKNDTKNGVNVIDTFCLTRAEKYM